MASSSSSPFLKTLPSPLLLSPLTPPKLPPFSQPCTKRNPNPNPKPLKISASSSSSSSTECPVPFDQQPINEYQTLATSLPFSWAAADLPLYFSRLASLGAAFALLLGLPVAAFGSRAAADADGLRWALGSASTGILAVTLAVLRMYLGWAYVGNRLLSATVEYEETGWYDGQELEPKQFKLLEEKAIWVKTPEVLARDRLLGSFSVKPVLNRVKITLIGLAVALVTCALLFINIENPRDSSEESGGRAIAGAYNDESARSFEPDAFCGEPDLS